jgi:hypothetical protein
MLNKMPKPLYKTLLGLFILGFTVVACNNKKKEEEKTAPKQDTMQPAPTPAPSTPDTPMMKKDSMGVVPDH